MNGRRAVVDNQQLELLRLLVDRPRRLVRSTRRGDDEVAGLRRIEAAVR
jgi:hypothetical protein